MLEAQDGSLFKKLTFQINFYHKVPSELTDRFIHYLGFNGTFGTMWLHRAFKKHSLVRRSTTVVA